MTKIGKWQHNTLYNNAPIFAHCGYSSPAFTMWQLQAKTYIVYLPIKCEKICKSSTAETCVRFTLVAQVTCYHLPNVMFYNEPLQYI